MESPGQPSEWDVVCDVDYAVVCLINSRPVIHQEEYAGYDISHKEQECKAAETKPEVDMFWHGLFQNFLKGCPEIKPVVKLTIQKPRGKAKPVDNPSQVNTALNLVQPASSFFLIITHCSRLIAHCFLNSLLLYHPTTTLSPVSFTS